MKYDVAIVGGSLAGTVAASVLARQGISVIVLDRAQTRRKPCGEGLSHAGRKALEDLEILRCADLSHRDLSAYEIEADGACTLLPLRHAVTGIRRDVLDEALRHALDRHGIIRRDFTARTISRVADGYRIEDGTAAVQVRAVLLGTGIHIPRLRGITYSEHSACCERYGVAFHAESRADLPDRVMVKILPDAEVYLTPVEARVCNVSVLTGKGIIRRYRERGNLHKLLESLNLSPPLDEILGAGPFAKVRRLSSEPNFAFIGDSAEVLDPIGGMGMTHAILSAARESMQMSFALRNPHLRQRRPKFAMSLHALRQFTRLSETFIGHAARSPLLVYLLMGKAMQPLSALVVHAFSARTERVADQVVRWCAKGNWAK